MREMAPRVFVVLIVVLLALYLWRGARKTVPLWKTLDGVFPLLAMLLILADEFVAFSVTGRRLAYVGAGVFAVLPLGRIIWEAKPWR